MSKFTDSSGPPVWSGSPSVLPTIVVAPVATEGGLEPGFIDVPDELRALMLAAAVEAGTAPEELGPVTLNPSDLEPIFDADSPTEELPLLRAVTVDPDATTLLMEPSAESVPVVDIAEEAGLIDAMHVPPKPYGVLR